MNNNSGEYPSYRNPTRRTNRNDAWFSGCI